MDIDDLIAGCLEGSKRHFDELYEKYSYRLYLICLRYSGDEDEAKDILQDGFIKVFMQLKTFDIKKGSFEGWLKRIFINLSIDYYRKKSISLNSVSTDNIPDYFADDDEEPEYNFTQEQLLGMIQELPIGYRTVFNLYVIDDLGHKEIASLLGISESTSKTQFLKAKKLLQKRIKGYLLTEQSIQNEG
jgi:RNA polymerase sigma factor (sigma-70 family)